MITEIPAYESTSFCYFLTREEAEKLLRNSLGSEVLKELEECQKGSSKRRVEHTNKNSSLCVDNNMKENLMVELFGNRGQKSNINDYALVRTKINQESYGVLMKSGTFYAPYGLGADICIKIRPEDQQTEK